MGFLTGLTDAIGLTDTDATDAARKASQAAQLTPFNFFGPGGSYGGFGTYDAGSAVGSVPQSTSTRGTNRYGFIDPRAGISGMFGRPTSPMDAIRQRYAQQSSTAPGSPVTNDYSFGNFQADQRTGQDIGFNLGNLEPLRQGFANFAGNQLGMAGTPMQTNNYLAGLQGNAGLANTALASSFGGLFNQPSSDQYRTQMLDLLRQEAAPFEQRAFNANQQNLFNTGRLGTTGGGLQTEAFARGLGQADLSRQIQAGQESRLASSQQDQLLSSAFGRFGETSKLAADLNQGLFGREQQAAMFPGQLQGQQLQLALAGLQGQTGLFDQGMSQFQAALNAAIARSNAAAGVASNLNATATQGGPLAGLFGGLASGAGAAAAGGSTAGLAALFSDSRLKDNLQHIGYRYGLPLYRWKWNDTAERVGAAGQPTEGVLAGDVRIAYPEAVGNKNGYLTVDYNKLEALHG